MNNNQINYPSTMPSKQETYDHPDTNYRSTTPKETESSKEKRQKLMKIQKKLILGLIFLSATVAYFGLLSRTYKAKMQQLEVSENLLNQYKKTFKNKPLKIINPKDGSPYTIEYFEAQVILEKNDSFYIKTYQERPPKKEGYLKPGGSYLWQDIKENINTVPGEAFSVTMIFSSNNRKQQTAHTFALTEERGTKFSPDFNKYNNDEKNP